MPKRDGVTVWHVAEEAGVSAQTVSRVLNNRGYASEAAREKVVTAAAELGYTPNLLGKSLRSTLSPMIGLVVADVANPFYARLHRALEHALRDSDLSVFLLNCDDDPVVERQRLKLLASYRPTGLVISPAANSSLSTADLKRFRNVVLVSRTLPNLPVPTVQTDEAEAFARAAQELFDYGHSVIAAVLGPPSVSTTQLRERGLREALVRNPGRRAVVRYTDGSAAEGLAAMADLLCTDRELSGVIGFNGPVTEGVLDGIRAAGLNYPDDISVIGFTDAVWMRASRPSITAVVQPVEEMGRLAGELIIRMASGQDVDPNTHLITKCSLVRRDSIAKPGRSNEN
jgi:DNA-binding LacI/PurR family transcriptional regulator